MALAARPTALFLVILLLFLVPSLYMTLRTLLRALQSPQYTGNNSNTHTSTRESVLD